MFTAFKLTNNGKALHIGAVNGNSIKFTKVAFGDGVEKTNYLEATELSNVVTSVPFTSYDNTKQNILNLKWELDTSKIPKSFDWCEYGLYAEDKDGMRFFMLMLMIMHPQGLKKWNRVLLLFT